MKTIGFALLTLGLVLAAVPAATSQDAGQTSFTLVSGQDGSNYIWKSPNGETNPTLTVPAGATVTVTIKKGTDQDGIPHNIRVGTTAASEDIMNAGDEQTYTFQAPASGTAAYECVYHKATMKGTVRVAGAASEEKNESPGVALGAVLAGLGVAALVARRRS